MHRYFIIALILSSLLSCLSEQGEGADKSSRPFIIREIPTACKNGGMPNLSQASRGEVYLSWIEFINDSTDALFFSNWQGNGWSEEKEIARGNNWFVNWADFPSLLAFSNNEKTLIAHWLQKSAEGSYDYDIHISISTNGGTHWPPSQILNDDGVNAEHGFVSLVPLTDGSVQALWLDGRNSKNKNGAMSLRTTNILPTGKIQPSLLLDERTCDCCQTDIVVTKQGLLAAYRDRSENETRDIALTKQENNIWSMPYSPLPDNWEIAGCPVNGPALAARGDSIVLVWFTQAQDNARVQCSFSFDGGKTFGPALRIDRGTPLGRVDVVWSSNGTACISWLEQSDTTAEIRLKEISAEGNMLLDQKIATTGPGRASGFPILQSLPDGRLLLAFTHTLENEQRVKTVLLKKK